MDLETAKNLSPEAIGALFRETQFEHAELLQAARGDFETKLDTTETKLRTTTADLQKANYQLDWFKRQLFGARSERRILGVLSLSDQLWLGEQFLDSPETPPSPSVTIKQYERKHRRKPTNLVAPDSQLRFDENVQVETVNIADPRFDGVSSDDIEIVSEKVSYRLAQRAPYVVLKIVRQVAKLKSEQKISCPPAPASVFPGSSADVSFLAGLVVDKFRCHLPLYRQHQRLEANGVFLDRGTLTRLVHRVGELLELVYSALFSSILTSSVLAVDETPTPAGRGGGKMKKGYYWTFFGDKDEVAFIFSPSRAQAVLDEALAGFEGKLLCDGYSAYEGFVNKVNQADGDVTLCQCWSHTRRNFIDAEKIEPVKVQKVLLLLQKLYKVEDRARTMTPEERLALRQEHSKPAVEEFFEYLENDLAETALLPSNPFVKAAEYAIARKVELQVYLEDPNLQIDTNHVERALRPQAVGRKNWMFHVTEVGARHGAIFYSLIQSCILSGVDPTTYFIDVLQRVDTHPASEVHLLTPRLWRENFQDAPLKSLLDREPDSS